MLMSQEDLAKALLCTFVTRSMATAWKNLEDHLYQEKRSDEWRQVESTATGCMARLLASFKIATHNNEAINAHTFCINYMQQL